MLRDLIKWALPVLLLSACGKELSVDSTDPGYSGNGGGGSTNGGLLTKVVAASSIDTSTTEYTYDVNKRLIKETYLSTSGSLGGMQASYEFRIYRNSAGLITKYTYITSELAGSGLDSLVYEARYNSATSRYTAIVSYAYETGFDPEVYDSTALTYNTAGKLIKANGYVNAFGTYELYSAYDYTYDASGNLGSSTQSVETGSGVAPLMKLGFTYDGKKASITLPYQDAVALNNMQYANSQNVLKTNITVYSGGAPQSFEVASTYKYNSNNQPSSANLVSQNGIQTATYFYK